MNTPITRPKCPTGGKRRKPSDKKELRQWRREQKDYRLWRKANVEAYKCL